MSAEAMNEREKLAAVVAMVDAWMEFAGPGTHAEKTLGPQVVSVEFVHECVHKIADVSVAASFHEGTETGHE